VRVHDKEELTAEEFLEKLKGVTGRAELLDNFRAGRFELRTKGKDGKGTYLSPSFLEMNPLEGQRFLDEVRNVVSVRANLSYVQW
jgi:hypothetical protein